MLFISKQFEVIFILFGLLLNKSLTCLTVSARVTGWTLTNVTVSIDLTDSTIQAWIV